MGWTFLYLMFVTAAVSAMMLQYGVWNVPVRKHLNRAVVVAQLLLGEDVGVVAMYTFVDAEDALYNACYCA